MALDDSALSGLLESLKAGDGVDVFREIMQLGLQALIEAEVTGHIGAAPHERTQTRTNQRNGSRPRLLSTKAGDVQLAIPKLVKGSFFPSLLEPRRRIDQALWAVMMEAYVHGTSTRKVDDLVVALGVDTGVSKSTVSRICAQLDEQVAAFRDRPLDHTAFPYVFLDATYVKARVEGRIVSRAVVIATGVTADGNREVLGVDVGDSEDEIFWTAFLRRLRDRGLGGVQLVISDAHAGLKASITRVLSGAAWQRCRVHFARNALARVPRASAEMVAATIRTILPSPMRPARWCTCVPSLTPSRGSSPRSPRCCSTSRPTSPPTPTSPERTGARSGPRTRSNGSTRRSSGAPTSSGSSPTTPPSSASSARSCSRSTTSGPWPSAATCPKRPWRSSHRPAMISTSRR